MLELYRRLAGMVAGLVAFTAAAAPPQTALSYRGQLAENGAPANGLYDLTFALFDAEEGGLQIGQVLLNPAVAVSNGVFVTRLDFGREVFDGTAYWLEIAVRTNGSAEALATLSPRQPVAATPYAFYAFNGNLTVTALSLTTALSELAETNLVAGADRLVAVGGTAGGARIITTSNLLESLKTLPNFPTAVSNGSTLYVSPSGDDATALRGRPDAPFYNLSNALAYCRNGDTIVVGPGCYTNQVRQHSYRLFDGQAAMTLDEKTNIQILAWGARFYWPTQVSGLMIRKCANVGVFGLEFYNNRVDPVPSDISDLIINGAVFGQVEVADSERIRLEGLRLVGAYDHGILADPGGRCQFNSTNAIVVQKCYVENAGGCPVGWNDGAGIVASAGWQVLGNTLVRCNRGIEVYPYFGSALSSATLVVGNTLTGTRGFAIAVDRCPAVIANNMITREPSDPTELYDNYGIELSGSNGSVVQGNYIQGQLAGVHVLGGENRGSVIAHNSLVRCLNGIVVNGRLQSGMISGNTFNSCTLGVGIYAGATDCEIAHNQFLNRGVPGISEGFGTLIYLHGKNSTNLTLWANTCVSGDVPGLLLVKDAAGVTNVNVRLLGNSCPGMANPPYRVSGLTASDIALQYEGSLSLEANAKLTWPGDAFFAYRSNTFLVFGEPSSRTVLQLGEDAALVTGDDGSLSLMHASRSNLLALRASSLHSELVATHDLHVTDRIAFPGHSAASNAVWTCTNADTGQGEWRPLNSGARPEVHTNFIQLQVQSAKLPQTNAPFLDSRYLAWEIQFPRTNNAGSPAVHSASWQFLVPPDYATNSLKVRLLTTVLDTSDGSGTDGIIWRASILRGTPGADTNVRTASFGPAVSGTNLWLTSPDIPNRLQTLTLDLGTNSLLAPGDWAVLKIERNATEDTHEGVSALLGLGLEYTHP